MIPVEEKSKTKLLMILDILNKESDEENILTINDIIEKLKENGIDAERKSVIRDIKHLSEMGYDISLYSENRKGYFMRSRDFDITELRLIIDAVLSAKFITQKKTKELIKKVEQLTSTGQIKKLQKNFYMNKMIKCQNEQIYYNIDKINSAINENKKISFQYYCYNINKEIELYRNGHVYTVSPYNLLWYEDLYYLVCNYDDYEDISHFRVDRMCNIKIIDTQRIPLEKVKVVNADKYINEVFNMFTGVKKMVEIKFDMSLLNAVIDKFGSSIELTKIDDKNFKIYVEVLDSQGFLGWILQFGNKAEILYPEELRKRIKTMINEMAKLY